MENPAALRRDMETVRDAETKDALREIFSMMYQNQTFENLIDIFMPEYI